MKMKSRSSETCPADMYPSGVPSMINVLNKYGEPRLYGNGETDLITKT